MNAHQLDANGVIINTVVVNDLSVLPNLVDASIGGSIGDSIINGQLVTKIVTVPVPESVPSLNARLTMIANGWMAPVRAYLEAMTGPEGEQAREYFDRALTFKRNHPLVVAVPAAIGKTPEEVDELFRQAASLNV